MKKKDTAAKALGSFGKLMNELRKLVRLEPTCIKPHR